MTSDSIRGRSPSNFCLTDVLFFEACHLEEMLQQSGFQGRVSVDGNGKPHYAARFSVDVVAAPNSKELPAVTLN